MGWPVIRIGTSLASNNMAGGSGNPSADSDRTSETRLFGPDAVMSISHNFHVNTHAVVLHAFGLSGTDKLTVQMVVGCKEGDLFEDVCIGGRKLELSAAPCNNILIVPIPGRYRLIYSGDNLGSFHAFYYVASLDAALASAPLLDKMLGG